MKRLITALALLLAVVFFKAGHWAMLLAIIALIIAHEFGHWVVARALGIAVPVFSIGFGRSPRIRLGNFWGTEFQLTPWLFGGYVKINPADESFCKEAAWKRGAVLVAGVAMNMLAALIIMFGLYVTYGQPHFVPKALVVTEVSSPVVGGSDSLIKVGDLIVSIDGRPVKTAADFVAGISGHKDGSAAQLVLNRAGANVTATIVPDSQGRVGINARVLGDVVYKQMNLFDAGWQSVDFTYHMSKEMFVGLGMMAHIVPPPPGLPDGATDVHGLVAIVQLGATAFSDSLYTFMRMVALISLNLAVLNILPIPVLDGGHLGFLTCEALTGKRVSVGVQERINMLFIGLLMLLMLFGLFNDIFKPV